LRGGWGVGVLVAILLPLALLFFSVLTLRFALFSIVLLVGVWTFVSAFAFAQERDRLYMVGWGVILALFSVVFVIRPQYAIALVLLGMVAMVVVYAAGKPKARSRATTPAQPATPSS